jgi:hypothetical protein
MESVAGVKQVDIGVNYYKVTYQVEFRRETFCEFILDQGFFDKDRQIFKDLVTGIPLGDPSPLNGRGYSWLTAKSLLVNGIGPLDSTITITDVSNFPPLATNGLANTLPPHYFFEVRIDEGLPTEEVLQVVESNGTSTFTVVRGYAGTKPQSHSNGATVQLEPYFLRFFPNKILPFAPLSLPLS